MGIAHERTAIPLLWNLLDKAGNATAAEHQAILQRFVNLFGKEYIAELIANLQVVNCSAGVIARELHFIYV